MIKVIDNVFGGTEFKRLKPGAVFKQGNSYFIKTEAIKYNIDEHKYNANAVGVQDGMLHFVENDEMVNPFACELIVL